MTDQLEKNKKNAMTFYDLMFNQNKPEEGIKKYVGDEYIQHNPEVGDGKEPFIEYFKRMAIEYPGKRVHFKRSIAEGNSLQYFPDFTRGKWMTNKPLFATQGDEY